MSRKTTADRTAAKLLREAEERDAHRTAQAALAEATDADRQTVLAIVAASPAVTGYSPRNLLFVLAQARKRDMTVTALDTYTGWIQRGRIVDHGQKALRLFARRIVAGKTVFRPVACTFDIAQTHEMTETEWAEALAAKRVERVVLPGPAELGAACLAAFSASLIEQAAERFGTAITGCPAELLAQVTALAAADAASRDATEAAPAAAAEAPETALDLF